MERRDKIAIGVVVGIATALGIYSLAKAARAASPPTGECIIWGFVRDSETGGPLPGVQITLDGFAWYPTAGEGQYEIRNIACKQYHIQFSKEGYVTASYNVTAQPKPYEDSTPFNVSLESW